MTWRIVQGDCIEAMRELDESAVDAIVCDPPYALGDSAKRDSDCLSRVLAEVSFPDDPQRNLGAVDLDGVTVEHEVHDRDEAAAASANPNLTDGPGEHLGDFVLQLAHDRDAGFCDGTCSCFSEPFPGGVAVPILAEPSSCLPRTQRGLGVVRGDANIRGGDDPPGKAESPASVVACAGAVDTFVLRLDLRRRAGELVSAGGAGEDYRLAQPRSPVLIRTRAGASGLPSVLEPYAVRLVGASADRTLTVHLPRLHVFDSTCRSGGFMSKDWDAMASPASYQRWCRAWAEECLRVLRPGGHLLAFGGTRTYHRLAAGIEDAGFEIRDCLAWLFGSGFPKSLNLDGGWSGWGTALKPAHEPIVMARKPLAGTVAQNMLEHGTGAINVDGCRIATDDRLEAAGVRSEPSTALQDGADSSLNVSVSETRPDGRWPSNVVLDEAAAAALDAQSGTLTSGSEAVGGHRRNSDKFRTAYGEFAGSEREPGALYGDSGGASRFFYVAKASRAERNAGLEGFEAKRPDRDTGHTDGRQWDIPGSHSKPRRNVHPTVKPIALMRWLVRLVTPPRGGLVLDPFAGSGTTGCAAVLERFDFVGIEREPEYVAIAEARIRWWHRHRGEGDVEDILAAGETRGEIAARGQGSLFDAEGDAA